MAESFLRDRSTKLAFGGMTTELEMMQTGIPQETPFSPILFLFFNRPLLEECSQLSL